MKKLGIIIAFIVIFIIAIFVGKYLYSSDAKEENMVKNEEKNNSIINQVDYSVKMI